MGSSGHRVSLVLHVACTQNHFVEVVILIVPTRATIEIAVFVCLKRFLNDGLLINNPKSSEIRHIKVYLFLTKMFSESRGSFTQNGRKLY